MTLQGAGSLTNDKITLATGTYSVNNINETLIADQNKFEVRFANKKDSGSLTMLMSGDAIFGTGETISTTDNTSTIDLVDRDRHMSVSESPKYRLPMQLKFG